MQAQQEPAVTTASFETDTATSSHLRPVSALGLFHTAIREGDSGSRMTCPILKLH